MTKRKTTKKDVDTIETEIIEPKKRKPRTTKKIGNTTKAEKVKSMPQTFVEDTFDLNNNQFSQETIIANDAVLKSKNFITVEQLLNNSLFQMKLTKLKAEIEYKKSFNQLLDFVHFSKSYRTYFIDDTTDEIDILLYEITTYFRKRLTRINLSYDDYTRINTYFDNLNTLYNRFNHGEGAIKDELNLELESMLKLDRFIKLKLF